MFKPYGEPPSRDFASGQVGFMVERSNGKEILQADRYLCAWDGMRTLDFVRKFEGRKWILRRWILN